MKSSRTLQMKNRQFKLQSYEQEAPNSASCSFAQNLLTLSPKLIFQSSNLIYDPPKKKQSKFWNRSEQRSFIQFWLQKIIENPYQSFSFDSPLKRKCYNKSVSQYIIKRGLELNIDCWKSPVQCKSKFGTIRRTIQRQRKKLSNKIQFGFIDFILQKAYEFTRQNCQIQVEIEKIRQLRQNKSPYVNVTLQEYRFFKNQLFQETLEMLKIFSIEIRNQEICQGQ